MESNYIFNKFSGIQANWTCHSSQVFNDVSMQGRIIPENEDVEWWIGKQDWCLFLFIPNSNTDEKNNDFALLVVPESIMYAEKEAISLVSLEKM